MINNTERLLQDPIIRKKLAVQVAYLGWPTLNETYGEGVGRDTRASREEDAR